MSQKQQQCKGIIIRTLASSEADLVAAILDEKGEKHVVIAKQARKSRKRFSSALDLFDFGRFETTFGKGTLAILQSFIPESGFKKLRQSLSNRPRRFVGRHRLAASDTECARFHWRQ